MKIKNYKNTPNKISYTACYDYLEVEIIHERTEFGVRTTDIEDFLEKVSMYSYEDADAIEAFKDFHTRKCIYRTCFLRNLTHSSHSTISTVYILELRYLTPRKRCSSLIASFLLLKMCSLSGILS